MIDRSFSLVNYRTPTAWQQMTLSRKHRFQQQRSNFDRKFVRFEGYGAKKLITEFLNKGWGLQGQNKLLKKLTEKLVQQQDEEAAFDRKLCERMTTLTISRFYIL